MRSLLFIALLLLPALATASETRTPESEFMVKISALEKSNGGRIGVSIITTDALPLLSFRPHERFAFCSTFKVLLSAATLSRVDSNEESLDRKIRYRASDLLEYAPVTKKHLGTGDIGSMTISELNAASIQYSDNTAANLLLERIGGPASLTDFLRRSGDNITRLDRNEPDLNTNLPGDIRDTTTPDAMAKTLQKMLFGNCLSAASQEQLKLWMFGNTTGGERLRAGFSQFWIIGDKTGSGGNGATNDVAIVYPRTMPPFIITVFYTGSSAANDRRNALIADIARIAGDMLPKQVNGRACSITASGQ